MDLGAKLRAFSVMRNPTPEGACNLFGEAVWDWIATNRLSPDQLQELIDQNRPILLEMLSGTKPQDLAKIQGVVTQVTPALDRDIHYALVVHRVSDHSREHAFVLLMHLDWLIAQLDAALAWLQNGSAAATPQ